MERSPILATITVTHSGTRGVAAVVNGRPQHFSDPQALFTAAAQLLEEATASAGTELHPALERNPT